MQHMSSSGVKNIAVGIFPMYIYMDFAMSYWNKLNQQKSVY